MKIFVYLGNFFCRWPDIPEVDILSILPFSNWLLLKVNINLSKELHMLTSNVQGSLRGHHKNGKKILHPTNDSTFTVYALNI